VNGNVVRLRDVETESILGTFQADTSLYSLAYDPDNEFIAVGDTDNRVLLWRPEEAFRTGSEIYPEPVTLGMHQGDTDSYQGLIWRLDFSPGGTLLASAGGDATVRIWDLSEMSLVTTLAAHDAAVTCIMFSPDGRFLASGGLDGKLCLWAVQE
jgi:WD40 repeat protein